MTACLVVNIVFILLFVERIEAKGGLSEEMEENIKLSEQNAEKMEKKFNNLKTKSQSNLDKVVFNIKPADDAHIRISYDKERPKNTSTIQKRNKNMENRENKENKEEEPKYFLNFQFGNNKGPKVSMDKNLLATKVKMRRTGRRLLPNGMPNPYKYFPLKGEDI